MLVARHRWWPLPPVAVAVLPGLLALGIYLWQLSVPEQLSFYDTGVYMAAAIHLVSGALPYKDFVFVQPPGLLYILSPIAALSLAIGSHDGEVVGRVLTSLVTAANCSLVAWLVRRHGRLAMGVAGCALAVMPVAFFVSSSVKLEPYCVGLVLAAALVLVAPDRTELLSRRSIVVAGLLIGAAALVKLWAFFPFVALVVVLALRVRRRAWSFALAAAGTFVVGASPFLIAAPGRFVTEVILEQIGRKATASDSASWFVRLRDMTGFLLTVPPSGVLATVVSFSLLVVITGIAFRRWRHVAHADVVILALAVVSVVMLFSAPEFYTYYAYFTAPFLVALAIASLDVVGAPLWQRVRRLPLSRSTRLLVQGIGVASGLFFLVGAVFYTVTFFTNFATFNGANASLISGLSRVIPPGACVVYDVVSYGVDANRMITSDPRCPDVVDVDGEWMAHGYQLRAPAASFSRQWQSYFERAQYVVFYAPHPSDIPWDAELDSWFTEHFQRIYARYYVVVYRAEVRA